MTLNGKTIVIGVTGGIAAYKALDVISGLKKLGANVKVIMTQSATEFISPLTFQAISQNPVAHSMFEEPKSWEIRHISLAKEADIFAIIPATANIIGKIANGIADDMLSTTVMATTAPVVIAPAMNTNMYKNSILRQNIRFLKEHHYIFIDPDCGRLACGDTGEGKLPATDVIIDKIRNLLVYPKKDLEGKKILITAGPTQEAIDPVRYITNHSSGKMGYALAKAACLRGADVTLISGEVALKPPIGAKTIKVISATDMYESVMKYAPDCDVIIKAAAVADYRPKTKADEKIKKGGEMKINLSQTPDILKALGEKFGGKKILIGFCMETQNLIENAEKKLKSKNLDLIVANSLKTPEAGFKSDKNAVTILDKFGNRADISLTSKEEIANIILDRLNKK